MKNLFARCGVLVFFLAVIIVSLVLILKKEPESEVIDTVNTIVETTETAAAVTEESETQRYGHDIDFYEGEYGDSKGEDEPSDSEDVQTVTSVPDGTETSVSSSRTIITSRQRKDYDKNSVYIDMENILQNPELPVGCEITALTILLRFYGFDAEKTDMAKNYLPTSWGNARYEDGRTYKDSFYTYFIGDPFSRGYGCFSGAIVTAAEKYIADNGGGYDVINISGCGPDTMYEYLIAGTPVLCWATDGMIEPEYYETWYDNLTGEQLDWYLNEHCFVLAGFDIKNNTVTLNDPMKGIIDYNIDKFEVRFKQMNRQAVVIVPKGGTAAETVTVSAETVTEESVTEITTEEASSQTEYAESVTESVTASVTESGTEASESTISEGDGAFTGFPEIY